MYHNDKYFKTENIDGYLNCRYATNTGQSWTHSRHVMSSSLRPLKTHIKSVEVQSPPVHMEWNSVIASVGDSTCSEFYHPVPFEPFNLLYYNRHSSLRKVDLIWFSDLEKLRWR
ncbi:hypothetical protein TNCV_1350691 [Trichonephila clavipes]|nr:hypothetical protein TNCV_1350691 [Trichonephila clavipes]